MRVFISPGGVKLKLKLIKMKIKELELKIDDKVRNESWRNGEFVTVTEEVGIDDRFEAKDENGHESAYGPYGDDWVKINN